MLYLLDTDHVSLLQRGGQPGLAIDARLTAIAQDDYGTSIVTYSEQMRGRLATIHSVTNMSQEVVAYLRLQDSLHFFRNIAVWDYTERAAAIYETLKRQRVRVGTQDLKIASIALANSATLLTCNLRDFQKIPGLVVEDWSLTS